MSLRQEDDADFVLDADSVWITIKGFSVYLKKTSVGVAVDIFKRGQEMEDPIAYVGVLSEEECDKNEKST